MASLSLLPYHSTLPLYPSYSSPSPSNSKLHINFCSKNLKPFCCISVHQSNDSKTDTNANNHNNLRVVFAAGGTGGHIYPAVAIADELKSINPTTEILFIGSQSSMESSSIPSTGFDFVSIPTTVPLVHPIFCPQNLLLPYRLIKSVIQCHSILKEFNPDIVVGTGGYVSFPVCLSAALQRIKVVIQEQNSVPGIANWVLSFFACKVFVAFNSTTECFPRKDKCVVCGNPVRLSLRTYVSKAVARLNFFPRLKKEEEAKARLVLVLGGSLGANAVNIALLNLYYQMLMEKQNLFIIWQTGVEAFNEMESLVRNHPRLLLTP